MLRGILLIILAIIPAYYGGVQPWSWGFASVICGLAAIVTGVGIVVGKVKLAPPVNKLLWPVLLLLIVLLWIWVQGVTWTPGSWHHPIWSLSSEALGIGYSGRISIDPSATYQSGTLLALSGLFLALSVQAGRKGRPAINALHILAMIITLYATVGFVAWLVGGSELLWFDTRGIGSKLAGVNRLELPFGNANLLAAYAGLGLVILLGLMIDELNGFMTGFSPTSEKLKRYVLHMVSHRVYLLVASLLLATVLVLTQSRGGLVSVFVGVSFLIIGTIRGRLLPHGKKFITYGLGVCLALAFMLTPTGVMVDRLKDEGITLVGRAHIYDITYQAIEASPLLGYGYGTYPGVYNLFAGYDAPFATRHAHSSVLEIVVDLGIPFALVLALALGLLVIRVWKGIKARRRQQIVPIVAFAVTAQFLTHSLIDIPLQVPAIGLSYAFVLGLGFAQSWPTRKLQSGQNPSFNAF